MTIKKNPGRPPKAKPPVVEEPQTHLSWEDIRNMEAIEHSEQLVTKDILLARANLVQLEKDGEKLKYQMALRKKELGDLESTLVGKGDDRRKFRQELAEKYRIEGAWAYHPDTAAIMLHEP